MSGFSADWLHLREPFDHQARQVALSSLKLPMARWREKGQGAPLQVLDMACGSGSSLRALAPVLGGAQHWRLFDHDPTLLAAVAPAVAEWAKQHGYRFEESPGLIQIAGPGFSAQIERTQLDLARDLAQLPLAHTQLVTGSALLDLVSADWLSRLVPLLRQAGTDALFALNVDGQTHWSPADPDDSAIHRLFSAHQRRNKGFGPALGGQAVAHATALFSAAGYTVAQAASDWVIDGTDPAPHPNVNVPAMLNAMIEGSATAALEQALEGDAAQAKSAPERIQQWQARRLAALASTRLQVGHIDFLATVV